MAYKSSSAIALLDSERAPQHSFVVPGWGAVALADASAGLTSGGEELACHSYDAEAMPLANGTLVSLVSACEAQQVASAWASTLRAWLLLPPEEPVPGSHTAPAGDCKADRGSMSRVQLLAARPNRDGICDWELRAVAMAVVSFFLHRTAVTLENLVALIDSLPDVVVRPEIGQMMFKAVDIAHKAAAFAAADDLVQALASARSALELALTASHDDTIVAQMYFSWDFKYAVYLPIGLPVICPIVVAIFRMTSKARQTRKLLRERDAAVVLDAGNGVACDAGAALEVR